MLGKEFWSRRQLFNRSLVTGIAGVSAAVAGFLAPKVLASTPASATSFKERDERKRGPIGAWSLTITFPDNDSQENGLIAFALGGVLTTTADKTRCTCIGAFEVTGKYTFTYAFREQLFDANGIHFADVHTYIEATLNETFDLYEGIGEGTVYLLNGTKVRTRQTQIQAVRIEVKRDE